MPNRDEFTPATKRLLAARVGYLCSHPQCRHPTLGPAPSGVGTINVGEAAHITAAASGGPRWDPSLSSEERKAEANGIWMCGVHAKEVDSDEKAFPIETLRKWKAEAIKLAFEGITTGRIALPEGFLAIDVAAIERLGLADSDVEQLTARMTLAAREDINGFKSASHWPVHAVELQLRRTGGAAVAFPVTVCASAVEVCRQIIIVAQPGTGKSTTCVQLVAALLDGASLPAALIPLNEWSALSHGLLDSLTHRTAFRAFREQDFQSLATLGRLTLVLDGWNELDPASRRKAAAEINRLQRESPLLRIVVSTRRQAVDVPLVGHQLVEIQPLSDEQQMEIARAIAGPAGERLLDHAWRQSGLRDLVSIPLFLTALLQAPHGTMPETKEEVLRLYIEANERIPKNADALRDGFGGLHFDVLRGLAVTATRAANTTISDAHSRSVVADVEQRLKAAGQITTEPQPIVVLDLLVSHHTLTRIKDSGSVSFQHEQIQEWYASFEVERLMHNASAGDPEATAGLRADVLNWPVWEEAILFACERVSRSNPAGVAAVAGAIIEALAVDPMLASEMIQRSAAAVWDKISLAAQDVIRRWHAPGKIDRALRFMITSGRPEFIDYVWPLITNEDDQISLGALRTAKRFQPSILGSESVARIAALPPKLRHILLCEIASNSGIDGLDLAAAVARDDPDPEIKVAVIDTFAFRRADRHVVEVLGNASEVIFDSLVSSGVVDDVPDHDIKQRLGAARERLRAEPASSDERLRRRGLSR